LSIVPLFKPANQAEQTDTIKVISKKILSTLVTLGDSPLIRYFDPSGQGDGVSAKLAKQVKIDMEELISMDESFPPANDFRKTILIIVDRTFDMMAPFIHEFTYQAMMHDILSADKAAVSRYT
jgi:syntaxin-binding protein 1